MKKTLFLIPLFFSMLIIIPLLINLKKTQTQDNPIKQSGSNVNNPDICKLYIESSMPSPINIVILGDGFTSTDIANGYYEREIAEFLDKFFYVPPYQQFINYFNVYIVLSVYRERGADDSPGKDTQDTVFNSTFGTYGIQRLLTVQDYDAVRKYVAYATNNPHVIIILVNDERYGGAGGRYAVASINKHVLGLVLHEMGHAFGDLADEYVDEAIASKYSIDGAESAGNVDLTGNTNHIKWSHFIGLQGYDMVGAYEGAYFRSKGVWRPQYTCMMRSISSPYCHVCRELITKEICRIINMSYDFDSFIEHNPINDNLLVYDPVNINGDKISPYSSREASKNTNDYNDYDYDSYDVSQTDEDDYSYSTDEIYTYYNGYFINKGNLKWEEVTKNGSKYYYTESKRDEYYIYIYDFSRDYHIAVPIGHMDLYYWDGYDWLILYKVEQTNSIPNY